MKQRMHLQWYASMHGFGTQLKFLFASLLCLPDGASAIHLCRLIRTVFTLCCYRSINFLFSHEFSVFTAYNLNRSFRDFNLPRLDIKYISMLRDCGIARDSDPYQVQP
ncbi:hypothetical protein AQUCO_03900196v1 [Aquilegia coerulea]|uniref:Uncharacterized protein n=1 Tax=Aquilegia coerulea TaxID=218851 RepID=A0A2G5CS35_AQUCA|nr:hypothetical protein AQUCO_03900196v1 [Aquilegia coerulea]